MVNKKNVRGNLTKKAVHILINLKHSSIRPHVFDLSILEGHCESSWDFFRGRCLQALSSPYNYAGATVTCNGGHLLTIHYPEEITDLLNKYTCMYLREISKCSCNLHLTACFIR